MLHVYRTTRSERAHDATHVMRPPRATTGSHTVEIEADSTQPGYCAWGRGAVGRGADPVVAGDGVGAVRAGGL